MGSVLHDDGLAVAVGERLAARGERLAVAETTSGGLISARLLAVPGASAWFDHGVVCYGGRSKQELTGVADDLLRTHGSVSAAAVAAMATGLRDRSGVGWTIAESGIAGPQTSRRSPKPVGHVVIAVAGPGGDVTVVEEGFGGTRVDVMLSIGTRALTLLRDLLDAAPTRPPA